MKITRTLLLVLAVSISLAGLTTTVTAAEATTQPAGGAGTDDGPKLTEADRSDDATAADDSTQPAGQPTSQPGGPKQRDPGLFSNPMFLLIGAMLLMFIFMGRGKRKNEAKRKEMLAALKKGDKVTTIGGIIGTVMEVRDDEVTVKIDEGSNARMRFARWAVRGVGSDAKTEEPEDKK
ncbi:MAG: preprotein translocase subunit YajC [Phycisphaerae bacterium]|jgi:preprotein translocase subunit YajC|nr:preprotein translocase subunit YajC [Phycisphaerae bacterium]